jgi:hypothetical protein
MSNILLFFILTVLASSQTISYVDGTHNFTFTQLTSFTPNYMANGTSNPSNYLKQMEIVGEHLYILDADSDIGMYSRVDPTVMVRDISQYKFNASFMPLTHMVYSMDESMVVLVRPATGSLTYSLYSIDSNTSWSFRNATVINFTSTMIPAIVTMRGQYIYAYNQKMTGDIVHIIDYYTSSVSSVNLGTGVKNYSIAITPDRQKAVLWSRNNSQIYVHALNTSFTRVYSYSDVVTSTSNAPTNISFSSDSQLALLEYDSFHPTLLLNLTSFTIVGNITVGTYIYSACFLDYNSRFVLIQSDLG